MGRGLKRAAELDAPGAPVLEPIKTAVKAFMQRCTDLQPSTRRKYLNSLSQLQQFCEAQKIDIVSDLTVETLEAFRAGRNLNPITSLKELHTLRQFFGLCFDRRWISANIAKLIKGPRSIRPNDVEPYTASEVAKIIAASDAFGRGAYERSRARDGAPVAIHGIADR
jgi:site-specific recombinase XerD